MRNFQVVFFDGFDEVRETESDEVVFSTVGMNTSLVDEVVTIWNRTGLDGLGSGGELDEFLLNSEDCTQEERETITESLSKRANVSFIIQDWAGNRMFPDKTFESFEDGWEFVYENVDNSKFDLSGDDDDSVFQDIYVVEAKD